MTNTKLSNRLTAFLLAFVMALGMVPANIVPVLAVESEAGTPSLGVIAESGRDSYFHVITPKDESSVVYDENGHQLGNYVGKYTYDGDPSLSGTSYCLDSKKYSITTSPGMKTILQPDTDIVAGDNGKQYELNDLTRGVVASGSNSKRDDYPQTKDFWEWTYTKYNTYTTESANSCVLPGDSHVNSDGTREDYVEKMTAWMSGFTKSQFDRATQLAVWHSIWNINIEGAVDSNLMGDDVTKVVENNGKSNNNTNDNAYKVIAVAQALLLHGYHWEVPQIKEAKGGTFFGGHTEDSSNFLHKVRMSTTGIDGNESSDSSTKDVLFENSNSGNKNGLDANGIHVYEYQRINKDGNLEKDTATTGTINDLYNNENKDNTNQNIFKQNINGQDYYVIYFNFYTETDSQNTGVTITMDWTAGIDVEEVKKLGIFVTAINTVDPYQSAEFYHQWEGNHIELADLSNIPQTLPESQMNYGGNPLQVTLTKVQYTNPYYINIGADANSYAGGNGYRFYGLAKLCVPTWAYDTQGLLESVKDALVDPDANFDDITRPDFDATFTFSAPVVSQYNQYISTPVDNKAATGMDDNTLQPMLLCDGPAPVSDTLRIKWDGIEITRDIPEPIETPPPPPDPSDLTIKKIDTKDKNINLQGAKFELRCVDEYCSNYGKSISATTNSQGIATFEIPTCCDYYSPEENPKHYPWKPQGNPPKLVHEHVWVACTHDWELVEVEAPPLYEINGLNVRKINAGNLSGTVYYGSSNNPIIVENSIPTEGDVVINKRDSKTNSLVSAPAVFKLKGIGNGYETTFTTTNGSAKFQCDDPNKDNYIPYGSYSCWEISAPEGYALNSEPQYFQLEQYRSSQHIELNFLNDPLNRITIQKYDMDTGLPLKGVTFDYWYNGTYQGTTEPTNVNGKAYLYDLKTGTYEFQEKKVPENYIRSDEKKSVYVDTSNVNKVNYIVEFHNYKLRQLKITKLDGDNTNRGVSGAKFNIRSDDGSFNKNVTTDRDGTATVSGLSWGTYTITETSAPNGYLMPTDGSNIKTITIDKALVERDHSPVLIEVEPFKNYQERTLLLTKLDADTNKGLAGAHFHIENADGSFSKDVTTGANGTVLVTGLSWGTYTVTETTCPDGYLMPTDGSNVQVFVLDEALVSKDHAPVRIELPPFKNYQERSLKLTKLDAHSHEGVAGARFHIENDDGSFSKDVTTGTNGTVIVTGLSWGTYTITETNPPKGYLLPTDGSNVKTVVIDYEQVNKDHSPVVIEVEAFENHKEKTLIVTKVDAEMGWYLPDAEFKLTSTDGAISLTRVTGEDGKYIFEHLPFGTYQLEETKAPYGYDLPAEPVKTIVFDMNSPDVVEVTYEDHQQVDIILYKVDAATGKPLSGAEFELQDDDGNVVGRYITDSTGTATTERLEPGVYHAYEIKAPEGYALDSTPQWVKIDTENSSPKLLRFQDVPETSLLITKLDAQTDTPLMGAVFEVRDKDGNVIGRYTTGENGTVCTEPLNPQNYDVVEVIAPDGYALDKTEHPVTIVAGKANGIVIRDNQLATLTIYKADTDNKPIAGCTFKVETADGVFIGQYVTDSSGEAVISGINAGHYIITEVDPATGYVAVGTPKTITVHYGIKNRVEFTNAEYGGLLIKLVDQADGQWLPNGQFIVTHCADNNIVFTGTTDTAGTILVSNLIPGDKYIITQTFPPDGYTIIDSEKSEFVEAGMNKLVLFEDCTAGIVIEKVDKLTQDTLAGARFQLVRNSDNIVIGEYVTGTDGLAVASGLVPGMYTVREIEAPTNYYLDTEDKLVHVKAGTTAHVTFMDTPYSGITIKSVDDATNLPLAGTVFEVYMQNGNLIGSYTTDSTGTVQTLALEPGFYVIKQIFVQEGYSYDGGDRTVEVVNGVEVTETFRSVACGTLNIYATDNQNKGLPGMRGTVTKVNGEFVAEFVTGIDGMATLTGLSAGNYFVIEDKAPDGYQPCEEKQKTVTIKSNKPTNVYFAHAKTYGVQIKTTVLQTAKPIAGAKYRVTTPDGGIIGIYTSDEAGLIYATLDPGTYVITPVLAPDGYEFSTDTKTHRTETVHGDADSRVVSVKADRYTVVEFVVTQLSSVRVKLIDGNTKAGIYGIRLLLKDSKGTIVGEYWTNNDGYITLSRDLVNGKYLLEQITVPTEYALDTVPKDITILNGETTEVIWTMWKIVGQIQVELHSLDYNPTLDLAAGTLLMGGEFEVVNADTYQVVATMTSDANGVAATAGLPIGRYFIRQTKAPAYYGLSDKETEVRLKVANDVVRVQYYDPSLYLGVFNSQKSNVNVSAGTVMRYDVLAVSNCSTVQLDNFYWTIKVPTDAARIGTLYTGTWNAAVWYTVSYKTNMADYKVFMKNLSSTANHQMDLSSTALGLQSGEYVTEIRFEFGTVPSGFCLTNNPAMTMYVLPSVYNDYKIISRMEVGGKYIDAWVADTSLWTTTVKNLGGTGTANDPRLPDNLPKTGF